MIYGKIINDTTISFPTPDEFSGIPNWQSNDPALRAKGYLPLCGVPDAQEGKTLHLDKFVPHEQFETRIEPRPVVVNEYSETDKDEDGNPVQTGMHTEWRDTEISVDTSYIEVTAYHYTEDAADIEAVRAAKLAALEEWDNAELPDKGVNWFVIRLAGQQVPFWIKKADRAALSLTIDALEANGAATLSLSVYGQVVAIPLEDARAMLYGIEAYASASYVVTASHKAAIMGLRTVAEIEAYDFKIGYPDNFVCELGG